MLLERGDRTFAAVLSAGKGSDAVFALRVPTVLNVE